MFEILVTPREQEEEPIKKPLFRRILDRLQTQIALKTGLAAMLGWLAGLGLSDLTERSENLISGLWCALSAIVVMQAHLGSTYKASWIRLLGVLFGSFLGALFTILFGSHPWALGLSIASTVILCSFFNLQDSIRIACMSVAVIMISWSKSSESPWMFAFYRSLDSIMGIAIAVFIAHAVWPYHVSEKLRNTLSKLLSETLHLWTWIFSTESSEATNKESERMIKSCRELIQQATTLLDEARLEFLTNPQMLKEWGLLKEHLTYLFRSVRTIHSVFHNAYPILDNDLKAHLKDLVEQTDKTLTSFLQALSTRQPIEHLTDLEHVWNKFSTDLVRFRNTRATREFGFDAVESLFVFFYSINATIKEIYPIAKQINQLNEEI